MNYTDLVSNLADITEKTFTTAQSNMFIQQAEQKIYHTVQFPALRKTSTTAMTNADNSYTVPTDFLWVYSFAVINGSSEYSFLLNKDVNFIREAHPVSATGGLPKHYAYDGETTILLGPTPDSAYAVELRYGFSPESIVTAATTWLGDDFDSALLNGALVEAARFMKAEADIIEEYQKMYMHSLTLLKGLADGKLREDAYRSGQDRFNGGGAQ